MSLRPMIYPVKTLEPIRNAIGSKDTSLIERMVESYKKDSGEDPDSIDRVRNAAKSLIAGELRKGKEPGEWVESIYHTALALGLMHELPINEDWKWIAWSDYFAEVADRLPGDARQLLHWLVEGRPIKGSAIDGSSGCYYAWLAPDEVERLLAALTGLQEADPNVADIVDGFHGELLEWLEACRGKSLLLLASEMSQDEETPVGAPRARLSDKWRISCQRGLRGLVSAVCSAR
jgi:hypothetical protein